NGKLLHFDVERKRLQAADATQLDRLRQRTVCPERTFGNPDVEGIAKRSCATRLFGIELRNGTIFLAFQMQSFGRYLAQMNFHSRILSEFTRPTFQSSSLQFPRKT